MVQKKTRKWDFVSFITDNFDSKNRINPIRDRIKSEETLVDLLDAIFPLGYSAGELTGANKDSYSNHVLATDPSMFGVATPLYDLYIGIWNDTFNAKIPSDKFNR